MLVAEASRHDQDLKTRKQGQKPRLSKSVRPLPNLILRAFRHFPWSVPDPPEGAFLCLLAKGIAKGVEFEMQAPQRLLMSGHQAASQDRGFSGECHPCRLFSWVQQSAF